ncbi:nucleoside triphosphate pyrophosphatase [Falsirhodobacter sp. alg1]|uniref:Maf family protein n=1 Tax=Falsirhodobacter sp. alg1 TaxID=1472418 RepID=UPI0005EE40EC|nr:Maf family protein [Falsirhodobacter sp. alg1]
MRLILATISDSRRAMFSAAAIPAEAIPARIDEAAVKASLLAESARPRDIADALAEMKARKIAEKNPDSLVIGSDQVLECEGTLLSKPESPEDAVAQLSILRGKTHKLISAVVVYEYAQPVWRHISEARLTMGSFSDSWLRGYVDRNWNSIRHSVGGYKVEEEGVRLFIDIRGDHFTIMGMPMLPLLAWMGQRGIIET